MASKEYYLLQSVIRDLQSVVLADVSSPRARLVGNLALDILNGIKTRLADASFQDFDGAAIQKAAEQLSAVVASSEGGALPAFCARLDEIAALPVGTDIANAAGSPALDMTRLESDAREIIRATAPVRQRSQAAWRTLIELEESQNGFAMGGQSTGRDTGFVASGSGAVARAAGQAELLPELTAELVQSYLRAHRGSPNDWLVSAFHQVPGGFSKDTVLLTVETENNQAEKWVLRRDQLYSSLRGTVIDEFALFQTLWAAGFPIPEPLWCESGSTAFGAPVMITRCIAGSANVAAWSNDPEKVGQVVRNAAKLLVQLQRIDPALVPTPSAPVPGTVGYGPRQHVDHLYQFWKEIRTEPVPLMEACFEWLEQNAPSEFTRRVIVHGDFGLHNVMIEGTEITGLLDWEFSHIGDPHHDLAYVRPFVEAVAPWEDFVRCYQEAGGIAPDDDLMLFYGVFSILRISVGCFSVAHALYTGNPTIDTKQAWCAWGFSRRFLIEGSKLIAAKI